MKKLMLFITVLIVCSCEKDAYLETSPMVGKYVADSYIVGGQMFPYPINGKSINMSIFELSKGNIAVNISAPENDIYSPNMSKQYSNAAFTKDGSVYTIWLNGLPGKLDLYDAIQVYANKNIIDYYYKLPESPYITRTIRLKKVN